jgi:hypothetical protein
MGDTKSEHEGEPPKPAPEKSFGNMSEQHWSRARAGTNAEALDYYRQRSHAPGVEAGGAERNFYCMQCDGVIPFDFAGASCPHCGVALEGMAKRYFNWVEINEPARSDFKALLPFLVGGALLLALILAWVLLRFA